MSALPIVIGLGLLAVVVSRKKPPATVPATTTTKPVTGGGGAAKPATGSAKPQLGGVPGNDNTIKCAYLLRKTDSPDADSKVAILKETTAPLGGFADGATRSQEPQILAAAAAALASDTEPGTWSLVVICPDGTGPRTVGVVRVIK